jgi:hypothetical protein
MDLVNNLTVDLLFALPVGLEKEHLIRRIVTLLQNCDVEFLEGIYDGLSVSPHRAAQPPLRFMGVDAPCPRT